MTALIMASVMIMAVWFGMRLVPMTQTLGAVSLVSGPATNEIVYHAVHGHWPSPVDQTIVAGNTKGSYVNDLALGEDGVITAQLTIGSVPTIRGLPWATGANAIVGSLSFRPQLLGSRVAPTITFLCGYASPVVSSAATSGTNLTTLDKQLLPPFCR